MIENSAVPDNAGTASQATLTAKREEVDRGNPRFRVWEFDR
jgi:hypothetical protein